MLHGRRFPQKLKGAVYKSYIRPAILYGSEAWCLKESEMGILRRKERLMVRAMCRVQLKDRKIHGESNVWSTAQRQKKIYGESNVWSTAQRQKDPWREQCVEYSSKTERSMESNV